MYYNLIASAEESTVLAQYVREERAPYGSYQSEEALERGAHPSPRGGGLCLSPDPR